MYDVLTKVRDVLLCDLADAREQLAQLQQKIDRMITANEWLMQDRAKVIAELHSTIAGLQQQLVQIRSAKGERPRPHICTTCECGENYHNDAGECLRRTVCGCTGYTGIARD